MPGLEVFMLAVLLGVAMLPVVCFAPDRRFRWLAAAMFGLLVTAGLAGIGPYRDATLDPPPVNRPVEIERGEYTSSDACRACHPGEYDSWAHSWHRTMTQVVTPETMLADFEPESMRVGDWRFDLGRDGDTYWIEMSDPKTGGRKRAPIVLSTGSHHMQLYWFSREGGRDLSMAPFVYLKEDDRWTSRGAVFIEPEVGSPRFEHGRWNRSCIYCHTTGAVPRVRPGGAHSEASEFGITCESCHGEGGGHVNANAPDVVRRYRMHFSEDPDPSIVHPARLPKQASVEVCGQCHGVTQFPETRERFERVRQTGFDFRPGDSLEEQGRVIIRGGEHLTNPRIASAIERYHIEMDSIFWSDGMVRVPREYNGLLESPCYQRGEMTCLSCHTMHKSSSDPRSYETWADDQLSPGMRGDQACLQCHPGLEPRIEAHTRHAETSSGSRCQNCHMPYTAYGLLKAIRQHQVDSPSVAATVETGRPNACNACHLDRSLGWAADHLNAWFDQPVPKLTEEQRSLSAGAEWLVTGDAAERALAAWLAGWEPARSVSGRWTVPLLGQLLEDPYPAVRYIAWRSLGELTDVDGVEYDYIGPEEQRAAARREVWRRWSAIRDEPGERGPSLLLYADGSLDRLALRELIQRRDDRYVHIAE